MDHGTLTDNNGRKADFRHVISVMTTNAGAYEMSRTAIGFTHADNASDGMEAIRKRFSPEFRNRLDAVVQFDGLDADSIDRVVDKLLVEAEAQLEVRHVSLSVDEAARRWIAVRGYEFDQDMPGIYHNLAAGFSFCDGHSEIHQWKGIVLTLDTDTWEPKLRDLFFVMLPVAANTGGFSTECVVTNPGTAPLTLRLAESSSNVTLQPGEQRFIPEVLSTVGASGAVSARAVPVRTVSGIPAEFFAGGRTFRPASAGGSYGLFYPAVTTAEATRDEAWIYGLRQDGLTRSNLAVANVDPPQGGPSGSSRPPISLAVDVFDGDTGLLAGSVTVSLNSMASDWKQINSILGSFGLENGYARVRVVGTAGGPGDPFLVYGVINDGAAPGQGTSDGSYLPMAVPLPPSPFPP
jgi:hypothetical protein